MTSKQVSILLAQAQSLVSKSWEHGVYCETLLEIRNPELSVFAPKEIDPFPDGEMPKLGKDEVESCPALKWASSDAVGMRQCVELGTAELVERTKGDDAAGDPSSLGIPALLIGNSDHKYFTAACRQANFLLSHVPRTSKGAISHRYDIAEAWSDFVYMVPPFLAYLSVSTGNIDYIRTAVTQIQLYRDELRISEGQYAGQWRHIIGPQNQDEGSWTSGCGWAAMGMARVLATILKWRTTRGWEDEQAQLKGYISELLNGALASPRDPENGLLRNYLNDETYVGEAAGTALLAATTYRMAVLVPDEFGPKGFGGKYLAWADESKSAVERCIDEHGLVAPVVNPLRHRQREPFHRGSPEGQCFVALMLAAHSDYIA